MDDFWRWYRQFQRDFQGIRKVGRNPLLGIGVITLMGWKLSFAGAPFSQQPPTTFGDLHRQEDVVSQPCGTWHGRHKTPTVPTRANAHSSRGPCSSRSPSQASPTPHCGPLWQPRSHRQCEEGSLRCNLRPSEEVLVNVRRGA